MLFLKDELATIGELFVLPDLPFVLVRFFFLGAALWAFKSPIESYILVNCIRIAEAVVSEISGIFQRVRDLLRHRSVFIAGDGSLFEHFL